MTEQTRQPGMPELPPMEDERRRHELGGIPTEAEQQIGALATQGHLSFVRRAYDRYGILVDRGVDALSKTMSKIGGTYEQEYPDEQSEEPTEVTGLLEEKVVRIKQKTRERKASEATDSLSGLTTKKNRKLIPGRKPTTNTYVPPRQQRAARKLNKRDMSELDQRAKVIIKQEKKHGAEAVSSARHVHETAVKKINDQHVRTMTQGEVVRVRNEDGGYRLEQAATYTDDEGNEFFTGLDNVKVPKYVGTTQRNRRSDSGPSPAAPRGTELPSGVVAVEESPREVLKDRVKGAATRAGKLAVLKTLEKARTKAESSATGKSAVEYIDRKIEELRAELEGQD